MVKSCFFKIVTFRYFPPSATQEILDEFRPKLCPLDSTEITTAIEYLGKFLPICVKPELAAVSYELWFKEFMDLWQISFTACYWENVINNSKFFNTKNMKSNFRIWLG